MTGFRWFVLGYYAPDVEPPKEPGALAIEVGNPTRDGLQMDVDVLERRTDIGEVEILGPFDPPVRRP